MAATKKSQRFNQGDIALILGVSQATISEWTTLGKLPKPEKLGRVQVYEFDKVVAAVEKNFLKINPPRPLDEI